MKFEKHGKPITGSKSPETGHVSILLIIGFIIFSAIFLTGGLIPIDPNGPKGPPTLPPYFSSDSIQEEQKIILPPEALMSNPKGNLQLKTFKINTCTQKSGIDILIDTSGSMADDNKIDKLKNALKTFTKDLSGTSAISIQTFSNVVTEKIPWGLYKNNKTQVQTTINNLNANGWTRMKDGFTLAKQKLSEAITQNKFPGYNYSMLLISDGVPEIPPPGGASPYDPTKCDMPNVPAPAGDTRNCYVRVCDPRTAPALRCFAKEQDPRTPANLPQDIKTMGIPIYVIGLYSNITSDNKLRNYLEPLLKDDLASKPVSTHYYTYNSSDSTENLKKIFDNIFYLMCKNIIE